MSTGDLLHRLEQAAKLFDALPPVERAIEIMEQRRSLVRGLSKNGDESVNKLPEFVLLDEVYRLRRRYEWIHVQI